MTKKTLLRVFKDSAVANKMRRALTHLMNLLKISIKTVENLNETISNAKTEKAPSITFLTMPIW